MLPNMVASTVWNTRAKTDVPQKTRAVRSHRTPENRFSSASVHFRTPSSSPRAKKERKRERKREREKERERHVSFISFIYPYYSIRVFFVHFPSRFFPHFLAASSQQTHRYNTPTKKERRRPSCVPRRAAQRRSSGASGEVSSSAARDASCLIESKASRKRFDACRARRGGKEGSRLRF